MSSKSRVIRFRPQIRHSRPFWDEPQDDPVNTSNQHAEAIGFTATSFNKLEVYFRMLIGFTFDLADKGYEALLINMGNASMGKALRTY